MFLIYAGYQFYLLVYPPLPPDLYFSMQLAQPVNTIRNEFTHERCAERSSLQSRNFSSMGQSRYVKSPPALFSNCLQQMFMEDEVGLLQTVFFLWRFRSSDGLRQFCGRCMFFFYACFYASEDLLLFIYLFFAAHLALFFFLNF